MILFKEVNTLKIEEYIRCAWDSDRELEKYYDRSLKRRNINGMVYDTSNKIRDMLGYDEKLSILGVELDKEPIGFIVLSEKYSLFYSFGLSIKYRTKEILTHIFYHVRTRLKNNFYSVMNKQNTRAIDWLKKCGMKEDPSKNPNDNTLYLKFEVCQ